MTKTLFLAAGGALGALLRYYASGLTHRLLGETFPWGTLVVNLSGCLVIGFLWGLTERAPLPPAMHVFIFAGILGGFTTFSTYGLETLNLLRDGEVALGLLNVVASTLLGFLLVYVGLVASRALISMGGAS